MVSLFSALNISAGALTVNESAISVVSHNVANMNTEGYSKQRVNLQTRNIAGAIGNNVQAQIRANGGVMIANVMRYNNEYLNNYYRDQLSKLSQYEQQLGDINDLADMFNDLDGTGIGETLKDFYEALNNLNEYPASSTARVNFIETTKTLVSALNSKNQELAELGSKALGDGESEESLKNSKIYLQYSVLNDKLEELAAVNKALQCTQTGTLEANNLLDKRDLILNDIAKFTEITVEEKANGSVNVYTGDAALVKGATVVGTLDIQTAKSYCEAHGLKYPEEWVYDDGSPRQNAVISIKGEITIDNANDILTSGALGGLLHSADTGAEGINPGKVQESIDKIANAIAYVFNDLNTRDGAYCIDKDNTGILKATDKDNVIFVGLDKDGNVVDEINAGNIAINPELLTDKGIWNIACAYFKEGENFDEKAVGNAQNVVDMLGTRNQKLDGTDGSPDLDGMSIEDYYSSLLGKIAAGGNSLQTLYDTQGGLVDSIYNQIKSNNSVDINEELVDLVKYQTAYAAAAQVFNTCNTCLDTLMTLGR